MVIVANNILDQLEFHSKLNITSLCTALRQITVHIPLCLSTIKIEDKGNVKIQ